MILPVILALISLSTMDPSGDAFGDGSLTLPTAPIYANAAVFDLQSVTLDATPDGTRLGVTLGALGSAAAGAGESAPVTEPGAPPDDAAAAVVEPAATEQPLTAFVPSIVDVYLGEVPGGFDTTLPGPDLLFPQGSGWLYAVRITGDGAYYVAYPPPAPEGQGAEQTLAIEDLPRVPLQVLSIEDTLVVYLPFTLPDDIAVQALVGVYNPFSQTGWRPLASSPSPWAFAGDGKQVSPVIDLIAPNADAQRAALQSGLLPSTSQTSTVLTVPWLWVMLAGVLVAVFGLVLRWRVRRPVPAGASSTEGATEDGVGEEPAADVLAAEVVAADVAGGKDQALLVDGRDELLVDTGGDAQARAEDATAIEVDAAAAADDTASEPRPSEPVADTPVTRGFSSRAEDSFLLDLDDPRAVEDFLSDDDEESFWHPRSRKVEPPALPPAQLEAPRPAQLPAPAPVEPAEPDENRGAD